MGGYDFFLKIMGGYGFYDGFFQTRPHAINECPIANNQLIFRKQCVIANRISAE